MIFISVLAFNRSYVGEEDKQISFHLVSEHLASSESKFECRKKLDFSRHNYASNL